jgi:hypothetical protein
VEMRGPGDLDSAFAAATQAGIDAIYAVSSRHMVASVTRIVDSPPRAVCRSPAAGAPGCRRVGSFPMARNDADLRGVRRG